MRKLISVFLAVVLVVCCVPVYAESVIIIDSLIVDEAGAVEVIGHATEWNENTQITFLAMTADGEADGTISGDSILYIDQTTIGNNGVFLIEFVIGEKFSEEDAVLRIGSDTGAEAVSAEFTVPKLPPTIKAVANNSVKYGCDVYRLDSSNLTSGNVIDSIITGGNAIYYKLGDKWYDLLNEKATTSAYLVSENAADDEEFTEQSVRYYYVKGVRCNLYRSIKEMQILYESTIGGQEEMKFFNIFDISDNISSLEVSVPETNTDDIYVDLCDNHEKLIDSVILNTTNSYYEFLGEADDFTNFNESGYLYIHSSAENEQTFTVQGISEQYTSMADPIMVVANEYEWDGMKVELSDDVEQYEFYHNYIGDDASEGLILMDNNNLSWSYSYSDGNPIVITKSDLQSRKAELGSEIFSIFRNDYSQTVNFTVKEYKYIY